MDTRSDAPLVSALRRNLDRIRARIESARARGEHAAPHVDLVVVTKSVEPAFFGPLVEAGVRDVGENRVQAAAERKPSAPAVWTWHGIGHLQRNKARTAAGLFDVFHALDSLRLARRLDELLGEAGRTWPVYLQVNASDEAQKGGVGPEEAIELLRQVTELPHLLPIGFMTMAKRAAEDGDVRRTFRTLRELRDEAVRLGVGRTPAAGLSMGMTNDFELAVEEGATILRVGRAVFEGLTTASSPGDDARTGGGSA